VYMKSKLQHTETWWAATWPPGRLCHRSTKFFRHVNLIARFL